jgi:hypothetical protein
MNGSSTAFTRRGTPGFLKYSNSGLSSASLHKVVEAALSSHAATVSAGNSPSGTGGEDMPETKARQKQNAPKVHKKRQRNREAESLTEDSIYTTLQVAANLLMEWR